MGNVDITNIVKEIFKISKTPAEAIGTCELVKNEIIKLAIEDSPTPY